VALQHAYRLRKNSDFQRVRQRGRRVTSQLLSLAWSENNTEALRIGFVVSKRISKHAVTRNLIKRLLSEAIRPYFAELPCGYDLVISAKNQIVTLDAAKNTQLVASLSVITLELRTLLRRTHLLVSSSQASEAGT
jgi:ribonuclease P protein component